MRILGVDPALAVTGYGIIDVIRQRISLIHAGAIITSHSQTLPERLLKIYERILKIILEYRPEVMVLEKVYVHHHHQTTAFLLGQARGTICLACAQGKIPLVEYAATRVKKAIVGKGLASKIQVQRMVATTLGLKTLPRYMDVTDALALAIAYSNIARSDTYRNTQ